MIQKTNEIISIKDSIDYGGNCKKYYQIKYDA